MFEINSGYIGAKRSIRSDQAIEDFEVPFSHINKDLITDFIGEYPEYSSLKEVKVCIWKRAAKSIGPSSWHHTGKFYNETDHYALNEIADELMENRITHEIEHEEEKQALKQKKRIIIDLMQFCVIEWQVWGGTRNHPKVLFNEKDVAILKGDWAHTRVSGKHNIYGRKIVSYKTYDTWKALTKEHPEYTGLYYRMNSIRKSLMK